MDALSAVALQEHVHVGSPGRVAKATRRKARRLVNAALSTSDSHDLLVAV